MIMDSKQADEDDSGSTGNLRNEWRCVIDQREGIDDATDETGQCIDVTAEDERYLVDEDVTNHAACSSCEHTHDIGGPQRKAGIVRLLETYDGEERQADGIKEEDGIGDTIDETVEEDEEDQCQTIDGEIDPLRHPERTLSQHQVTKRTSTYGSYHADDEGAKQIKMLG